jgi:hypothetical protein
VLLRRLLAALSLVRAHILSAPPGSFEPRTVASLLRSLSAAELLGTPLLQRLAVELHMLPPEGPGALSPRGAIELFAAFATLPTRLDKVIARIRVLPLLSRTVRAAPPGHLRASDLAKLLGAVTRRRYFSDGALFRFASVEVTRLRTGAFSVGEIAVIADSFAKAEVWDEKLFRHLSVSARVLPWESLDLKDAALICGALSCAETRAGSKLRDGAIFRHVSSVLTSSELPCAGCCSRPIAEILNAFTRSAARPRPPLLLLRAARTASPPSHPAHEAFSSSSSRLMRLLVVVVVGS